MNARGGVVARLIATGFAVSASVGAEASAAGPAPESPGGLGGPGLTQEGTARPPDTAALAREIPHLMEIGDVPALSVAVVEDGRPVWTGAIGVLGDEAGTPVDGATIFSAASLSKPVFSYVVLRLAERGEFDLDRPLADLIEYPRVTHDPRGRDITGRMVLSHGTGLPNWGGDQLELRFDPGSGFDYSGEGFVFLQRAVEHVTGMSLEELARREVFDPLGMTRSGYVWRDEFEGNAVHGKDRAWRFEHVTRYEEPNAAFSLLTTAGDYARFLAAVMSGRGLSARTLDEMLTPVRSVHRPWQPTDADDDVSWALGWGVQEGPAGPAIFHWGDNGRFKAYVIAYPASRTGVVYFASSTDGLSIAAPILHRVAEGEHRALQWLGYEHHDDPRRLARKAVERTALASGASAALRRYEETRRNPAARLDPRRANDLARFLQNHEMEEAALRVLALAVADHPDAEEARANFESALPDGIDVDEALAASLRARDFPVLPPEAPAGSGAQQACRFPEQMGTARCGVFRVFEDREAGSGRTIDIAFVVLEALDPAGRTGDGIILLPGGPGETFTDAASAISRRMPELRRTRDVVLVDVRGVGRSSSLSCTVPYPGGFESRFGTVFPPDLAAACRDDLSRRARLSLYTTANAVDDLEDIRRWLGYVAWNLNGTSYGTRVAQVYMRRHPGAVRTAVLNGVAPVAEPLYVTHAALLQRALDRLLAECRSDEACRGAFPDLGDRMATLFARFEAGPVDVDVEGQRVPFSKGDLSYALRGLLYGRGADVPLLIDRASRGDVGALARYYEERSRWVGAGGGEAGYHFSVLCAEDIAPLADEDVARATRDTFMGDHLIQGYRTVCDLWPHAELPASHWEPVASDAPTLLLSGGRDPVTPPEGGDAVAAHLTNSLHVVVPNGGHGVGGPCVEAMILRLVETATVEGLDASCIEERPPTRFRLSPASGRRIREAPTLARVG